MRDFVAVRRYLWANQTLSAGFAKIINPGDDKGIFQNASEGNEGHSKRLRIVYCYESPVCDVCRVFLFFKKGKIKVR